jgi:ubiquinone/menaquinone biosynthesis C-methylase UbiE
MEKLWWKKWSQIADLNKVRAELIQKSEEINKIIRSFFEKIETLKILQIGPGGNGEINFLRGERYAIDPIASFLKENCSVLIDPRVNFIDGVAEDLPFPDSFFDVILIINVLDHCDRPEEVLNELHRCLKKNGLLILDVHVYNFITSALHNKLNFIDKEHPHAFTSGQIESFIKDDYDIVEKKLTDIKFVDLMNIKRIFLLALKTIKLAPVIFKVVAVRK